MQFVVKFVCVIAIAFFFTSCTTDVPGLPSPSEVEKYQFCQYTDKNGELLCKSTYVISEKDCTAVHGEFFLDVLCTVPAPETVPPEPQ